MRLYSLRLCRFATIANNEGLALAVGGVWQDPGSWSGGRSAQPFFIMKQKQTLHPSKGQRVSSLILPVCAQGSHRHGHALDPLVEGHGGRKGGSSNRGCP